MIIRNKNKLSNPIDMKDTEYFHWILDKHQQDKTTEEEEEFLNQFYDNLGASSNSLEIANFSTSETIGKEMKQAIGNDIDKIEGKQKTSYLKQYLPYAAAAIILLTFGIVYKYHYILGTKKIISTVIRPFKGKTTLSLADGRKIDLDSIKVGITQLSGGTNVLKKTDGKLILSKASVADDCDNCALPTIISTAKGRNYNITLPDLSQVLLNAESSLSIPSDFSKNNRSVKLTGEAYFKIAKQNGKSFEVECREQSIKVLGTHFNVSGYNIDPETRTTLIEGSLLVRTKSQHLVLSPGQQGISGKEIPKLLKQTVDTDETINWTRDVFSFNGKTIKEVMLQLSRWYEIKVEYHGQPNGDRFFGEIPRNSTFSEIIKILELNKVKCNLQGNTLNIYSD